MKKKIVAIIGVGLAIGCFIFSIVASVQANEEVESIVDDIWSGGHNYKASSSIYKKHENSQKLENALLYEIGRSNLSAENLAFFVQTLSEKGYYKESIKSAFLEKADYILAENKSNIAKYLEAISGFSQYSGNYYCVLKDILPEEGLISYLNKNCEKAIFKNNANGYYDSITKELNASYEFSSYETSNLDTVTDHYTYLGDFCIHVYSLSRYRPTGEAWENKLLSQYDERRVSLQYKGQILIYGNFSEKFSTYVEGATAVYVSNDVVIVLKNGAIFSSVGEIPYTK